MARVRDERSVPGMLAFVAVVSVMFFIGVVGYTVLGPWSAGPEAAPATPAGELIAAVQDQPTEAELALAASGIVETFEVFGAKNPFERPLAQTAPPTTTSPDDGDPDDGGDDDGVDGGSTTTETPTNDFTPGQARRVELREIYGLDGETVANIVVDSVLYEAVGVGDVFATTFQVISLDAGTGCGEFLNGDVDFELCVGQEILK